MVINTGTEVQNDVLSEIEKIDGVHNPKYVSLNAEE